MSVRQLRQIVGLEPAVTVSAATLDKLVKVWTGVQKGPR